MTHRFHTISLAITLGMLVVDSSMVLAQACTEPDTNCQKRDHWNALASDGVEHTVADNFSPVETGWISEVCWWGAYLNGETECEPGTADEFEITYYTSGDGIPGAVLAGPFSQSSGTLTVTGPTPTQDTLLDDIPEYEFHATHAPVMVTGGVCFWIEIRNTRSDGCAWYWEVAQPVDKMVAQDGSLTSADGYDILDLLPSDMAFCLNAAIGAPAYCGTRPENDGCFGRISVDEGEHVFSNMYASSTRDSFYFDCQYSTLGDPGVRRDVWYEYTPPCTGMLTVDVCESNYDSKIALLEADSCPSFFGPPLVCNDDGCGDEPREPVHLYVPCEGCAPREVFDPRCFGVIHAVAPTRCPHISAVTDFCVDLARKLCREPGSIQSEFVALVEVGTPYTIRIGGYGGDDGRDFTEDPGCVGRVCTWDPTCCSDTWDFSCDSLAYEECIGDTGSGILRLDLTAFPPVQTNLRHVSEFLNCFSGSCPNPPCDPPIYPEPCCLTQDFDNDGDVDVDDFTIHLAPAMTGP